MPLVAIYMLCVLAASSSVAQDKPAADTRPVNVLADSGVVAKAVRAAFGGPARFGGKVRVAKPEADEDDGGGVMFAGPPGMGGESTEFEGAFEFLRTDKGETLAASVGILPVLGVFDDGKDLFVHTVAKAGKAPGAARFSKMLLPLVRGDALSKAVEKAVWKAAPADDGGTTYTGSLPKSLLGASETPAGPGGMMMFGAPSVRSIAAAFTVAKDGRLVAASYAVTRSDPMAAIRKLAAEQGESGSVQISTDDIENMEEVDGDTVTFELARAEDAPSKRAVRLLKLFRERNED